MAPNAEHKQKQIFICYQFGATFITLWSTLYIAYSVKKVKIKKANKYRLFLNLSMVGLVGIEPTTPSLKGWRSTIELQTLNNTSNYLMTF